VLHAPQSVGTEHPKRSCLPSTLARERATCSTPPRMQPSCAVFHPADTRHRALAGRRDGAHHILGAISLEFGITKSPIRRLQPDALSSSFDTYLEMMQQAPRAVNRKTETTVRVSRHSVGTARLPSPCRTPACAPAPPSHATVIFRVSPSRCRP
jgi:hypothetical protein